jgi:hypothetical protein
MLRGIIRIAVGLAIIPQVAACGPTRKANLLDGCYYLGAEPILELEGAEGKLLLPGDVARFRLIPGESSDHIWMTTRPGFVIDGGDRKYIQSAEDPLSPSPLIIVEYEAPASSRILVRDNGEIERLIQKSCPTK